MKQSHPYGLWYKPKKRIVLNLLGIPILPLVAGITFAPVGSLIFNLSMIILIPLLTFLLIEAGKETESDP